MSNSTQRQQPSRAARWTAPLSALAVLVVVATALVVWFCSATVVVDLGKDSDLSQSGLRDSWLKGDVVVMIRHAERCDRSNAACLGSLDGITFQGSRSALQVGAGLRTLGLAQAQAIASPLTRTRQTAGFILGRDVSTQAWVGACDSGFRNAVIAHKQPRHNLVLVTHSGCMDQFERTMGVRAGQCSAGYAQAVFVKANGRQPPQIIGSLDASAWARLNLAAST